MNRWDSGRFACERPLFFSLVFETEDTNTFENKVESALGRTNVGQSLPFFNFFLHSKGETQNKMHKRKEKKNGAT